jgi:Secretion system C-terminal sorting domain
VVDDLVTLIGLDTDGDGLDDRFDSLNSVTNVKGTSYRMGNGGSLTGDATPGSRCTVQSRTIAQINRDWRFVGFILPVQIFSFTGLLQNTQVQLSWTILAQKEVAHFEVERSLNNSEYSIIGTITNTVKINEQQSFGYTDDISNISSGIIYYRLKMTGKSGEIKYSDIIAVKQNVVKTAVMVLPNPAVHFVSLRFFAEKETTVPVVLVDNTGRKIMLLKQHAVKGHNTITIYGLEKFAAGIYTLQLQVNDELITQKMVLLK